MASPCHSHYERLGVATDASLPELRQAFRVLSKRYHPDTTTLPTAEAEEAFRALRQAYSVLSDPEARAAYDLRLVQAAPPRRAVAVTAPRPASVRRSLSGGEWFALLLLALAMALSLLLGIGLAWARGTELMRQPSWWEELPSAPAPTAAAPTAAAPTAAAPTAAAPTPAPVL